MEGLMAVGAQLFDGLQGVIHSASQTCRVSSRLLSHTLVALEPLCNVAAGARMVHDAGRRAHERVQVAQERIVAVQRSLDLLLRVHQDASWSGRAQARPARRIARCWPVCGNGSSRGGGKDG